MASVLVCGAINWDTTCLVQHLPMPGEEVTCDSVSQVPGGTGANAAVAAARILGPDQVGLFGALGRDDIGRLQLEILESEGVASDSVLRLNGQASGHAYIFVDHTGQNVIASALGANSALNVRHARQARLATLMQRCRCLALTDPPLAVVLHLLETAAALTVPALWDPGVAVRTGWSVLAPIARRADSLLLNEAEAEQLFATSDPSTILHRLDLNCSPRAIILKQGSRGSVLLDCTTGDSDYIPPLPLIPLGLSPISTVGCGDVFLGVYAACLSRGHKRQVALLMASAAAGLNATRPETRGGPTANELERLLTAAAAAGYPLVAEREPPQ